MAITHVGVESDPNDTATTQIIVPKPSGVANGDLLIAVLGMIGQPTITSAPTGWTLLGTQDDGTNLRTAVYYKLASGELGDWTWGIGASFKNFGAVLVYRGHDLDEPIADWASAAGDAGTEHTTPEVHVPAGGWLVTAGVGRHQGDPARTWTINTGDSERYDHGSEASGAAQNITACLYDSGAAVVSAGDYQRTLTTSDGIVLCAFWSLALNPAVASGATLPWLVGAAYAATGGTAPVDEPGLHNDASGGVDGETVTTTDDGSGDPWSDVSIGTNGVVAYDDAPGAMMILTETGGSSALACHTWTLGTVSEDYTRFNMIVGDYPPVSERLVARYLDGTSQCIRVLVDADGHLNIRDAGNTTIASGTEPIPLDTEVRVEIHAVFNASTGSVTARWWTDPTSTGNATEEVAATGADTGAQATAIRFGVGAAATNAVQVWQRRHSSGGTTWWGPWT